MKRNIQIVFTVLISLGIYACTPVTPATQEAAPTGKPAGSDQGYYPLTTRTGLQEIDNIIAAAASGDVSTLLPLIQFTNAKCTTQEGLGGPPKCRAGEAEGTSVEVLPFMGPEGGFLRKDEIQQWQGINVSGLYAVYQVSAVVIAEQYYPVGEQAILFAGKDNGSSTALRIRDGKIVRVDTIFDISPQALHSILQREASTVLLAPPTP
jgi:hypothetical protein